MTAEQPIASLCHKFFLRSQCDEFYRLIVEVGLEPAEFDWREHSVGSKHNPRKKIPVLTHIPSGFFFRLSFPADSTLMVEPMTYEPGRDRRRVQGPAASWGNVIAHVIEWLEALKREVAAEGLWDTLERDRHLLVLTVDEESDLPFTAEEQGKLTEALSEVEERLLSLEAVTEGFESIVVAGFADLKNELRSMKRRQWVTLAVGTFMRIAIAVGLAAGVWQEVIGPLSEALSDIISSPPALP